MVRYFNPLRPRGRRRDLILMAWTFVNFNPLRPRGRRLGCLRCFQSCLSYFNPLRPRGRRLDNWLIIADADYFNPLRPRGRRHWFREIGLETYDFNPLRPRGRRQQYYTKKPTILHHISTIKSHHTPSNHRQPTLHTSKTVLIVQFFRCESPRKFMFASGSHQTI